MKNEYDYFIVTLCNTDLENQEIEFYNQEQAEKAADRLRSFLPVSLIHSVVLEGIKQRVIDTDIDGCSSYLNERYKLKF